MICKLLIEQGANVHKSRDIPPESLNEAMSIPLEICGLLIEHGNSLLYSAIINENLELLVKHGADVNAKDERTW